MTTTRGNDRHPSEASEIPPAQTQPRQKRAWGQWAAVCLGAASTMLFALAVLGVVTMPAVVRDVWVYNGVHLGAAVAMTVRAVRLREGRSAWAALAAAMAIMVTANCYYSLVLVEMDDPPYPSWADVGFLAFYPMAYWTLVSMIRKRIMRWRPCLWLDGLIIALASAALTTAFALAPLLAYSDADASVVATNLAYPLADVLLLSTVLTGFWLVGRQLDLSWMLLGAGVILWGAGDTVYLLQDLAGVYVEGTALDLTWVIGTMLMACASLADKGATRRTRDDARQGTASQPGLALVAAPGLGALASLGLLLPWEAWECPPIARWLAGGVVAVSILRTALTYRELWELTAAVRRLASTDELTGLANRRGFTATAESHFAGRAEGRLVSRGASSAETELRPGSASRGDADDDVVRGCESALLVLDLDRFKEVNDSLGHQAGDALLAAIGERLAHGCRGPNDVVARLGGDEFAILLPESTQAAAEQVATRIRDGFATPFILEGARVEASVSIGIAMAPRHGKRLSVLMRRADIATYHAKETGVGHAVYDPAAHDPMSDDQAQRVDEVRRAIASGQMVVFYEPKVDLATDEVTGVEALVRWAHPESGLLPPGTFLPLVEESGLMPALTATVLEQALAQAAAWRADGLTLTISVNLTPAEAVDAALPDRIAGLLDRYQLPQSALQLEITEESLLGDRVRARDILGRLRASGVRISIDDYGSGYSSLSYLRELTVDELKLDRSFITPMVEDARAAAIVRSTIDLAHSLGLSIVAEGVEHEEAADELSRYGCDIAQGYHYTRALPAAEFRQWLTHRLAGQPLIESRETDSLKLTA